MVFVLHRPVTADCLPEARRAPLLTLKAGDEVAGLAFEFVALVLDPLAPTPDQLPRARKGADVLIQIDPGEVSAFEAPVLFFPVAYPFVG